METGIIQLNGVQLKPKGSLFTEENRIEIADLFMKWVEQNGMEVVAGRVGFIRMVEDDLITPQN